MIFIKRIIKNYLVVFIIIVLISSLFRGLVLPMSAKENLKNKSFSHFDKRSDADKYYNDLILKRGIHSGSHPVVDKANNTYYWKNNSDVGSPSSGGYGDMRTYYKNGSVWKFKFKDKYVVDNVNFITLDKAYKNIPAQSVIFCIQPLEMAEWITGNNADGNYYQKLSQSEKDKVNQTISSATKLFKEEGNYDYLSAGQLMVWKDIGATEITVPKALDPEWNKLLKCKEGLTKGVSFSGEDIALDFNNSTRRYEKVVKDENEVLDLLYLDSILGTVGDYKIEKGKNANTILITSETMESKGDKKDWEYNPMNFSSGTLLGVRYSTTPIYINSKQDLVSGLVYKKKGNLGFNKNVAKGRAKIMKAGEGDGDGDGKRPLEDVKFNIYKINEYDDDELVETIITNERGEAFTKELPFGKYYMQEVETNDGYDLNDEKLEFEINNDKEVVVVNSGEVFVNKLKRKKVKIKKKDQYNNPVKDVEFNLYKDLNNNGKLDIEEMVEGNLYGSEKTNVSGELLFKDVSYGGYFLKEIHTPKEYIKETKPKLITVDDNTDIIEITNNIKEGKVRVVKKSKEDGIRLQNAEFTLYRDENNDGKLDPEDQEVEKSKTNKKGEIEFKKVKIGSYLLVETKAPTGYEKIEEATPVVIQEEGEVVEKIIENKLIDRGLILAKTGREISRSILKLAITTLIVGGILYKRKKDYL